MGQGFISNRTKAEFTLSLSTYPLNLGNNIKV